MCASEMVCCVLLHTDGKHEVVAWGHEGVHLHMGGPVTFVGGIPELQVFAVALRTPPDGTVVNTYCNDATVFMDLPIRGSVLFVSTDDDGEPIDVRVDALKEILALPE